MMTGQSPRRSGGVLLFQQFSSFDAERLRDRFQRFDRYVPAPAALDYVPMLRGAELCPLSCFLLGEAELLTKRFDLSDIHWHTILNG